MEFDFVLPRGYEDEHGTVHQAGTMRLASAMDEIEPLQDPRVLANEAYLVILLLARVVTKLGELPSVTPQVIERLFASDLAYLQEVYQRLNASENVVVGAVCPTCSTQFQLQIAPLN
jgi:hypothetical protein